MLMVRLVVIVRLVVVVVRLLVAVALIVLKKLVVVSLVVLGLVFLVSRRGLIQLVKLMKSWTIKQVGLLRWQVLGCLVKNDLKRL